MENASLWGTIGRPNSLIPRFLGALWIARRHQAPRAVRRIYLRSWGGLDNIRWSRIWPKDRIECSSGGYFAAAFRAWDAFPVEVEIDSPRRPARFQPGWPAGSGSARSARQGVRRHSGPAVFTPPGRLMINQPLGGRRKAGAGYDLPLALGILARPEFLTPNPGRAFLLRANFSLSGEIKSVRGVLPLALLARQSRPNAWIVPPGNAGKPRLWRALRSCACKPAGLVWPFCGAKRRLEPIFAGNLLE